MQKGVGGIRPLGIVGMAGLQRFVRGRLLPYARKKTTFLEENKMETKPKENLEPKTNCAETKEDQVIPFKYRDKDWKDFYFVTL